jgi:colicin import membrane protein
MIVSLRIHLVPTGSVVGVDVIKSSGDSIFDRSARRAVKKAENFPELQKIPNHIFEQYFRKFTLEFSPEDLRQ